MNPQWGEIRWVWGNEVTWIFWYPLKSLIEPPNGWFFLTLQNICSLVNELDFRKACMHIFALNLPQMLLFHFKIFVCMIGSRIQFDKRCALEVWTESLSSLQVLKFSADPTSFLCYLKPTTLFFLGPDLYITDSHGSAIEGLVGW